MLDPARTVFDRFKERMPNGRERSGVTVVSESLRLSYSSVYRWQISSKIDRKGLDGRIPARHYQGLRRLARERRISLPWSLITSREGKQSHG